VVPPRAIPGCPCPSVVRRSCSPTPGRREREQRGLRLLDGGDPHTEDPWDDELDSLRAQHVLEQLSPVHRAALTLRYLDDLPVPRVAALLGRTLDATEALSGRCPVTDPERPFRSLARPTTPTDPDPAFAAALRERLRHAS